jgi:thiamine-monophosphate kinase
MISKIREVFKKKDKNVLASIGDDAAVVRFNKKEHLVLAIDTIVDGVDFKIKSSKDAFLAGRKALAINLSDIAAMCCIPLYCVASVVLTEKYGWNVLKEIAKGIKSIADKFGVGVIGGDLSSGEQLQITVAITGVTRNKVFVTRKGSKINDRILVTGFLGGSIKGHHLTFTPRVKEAIRLVENFKISSMIDISDGLGSDIKRICEESNVGCRIDAAFIPVSKEVDNVFSALNDGEDFELLFTASATEAEKIVKNAKQKIGVKITDIGQILHKKEGMFVEFDRGKKIHIKNMGYQHFNK